MHLRPQARDASGVVAELSQYGVIQVFSGYVGTFDAGWRAIAFMNPARKVLNGHVPEREALAVKELAVKELAVKELAVKE